MKSKNKANGSAGYVAKSAANSTAVASLGATATELGRAGSDDASELSVANAASSTAARADRQANADPAELAAPGKRSRATGTASGPNANAKRSTKPCAKRSAKASKKSSATPRAANPFAKIQPGLQALPIDGEAFVDAVHSQVDLVQLEVTLLRSKDEKIVQRELSCLRELRYGKTAPAGDDEPQIIFDIPGPDTPERSEP